MNGEALAPLVTFGVGLLIVEAARRWRLVAPDVSRKLYLAGVAILAAWVGISGRPADPVPIFLCVTLVAYLSFRFELASAIEDAGCSLGSVLLPLSGVALFALFREERTFIAVAGMLAAGFGDTAAALVGLRTGTRRYRSPSNRRSMEGTLAMFFATSVTLVPVLAIVGDLGWHQAVAFALITATVAASVEAVSVYSSDNLTVPLATAATLASLVRFSQ